MKTTALLFFLLLAAGRSLKAQENISEKIVIKRCGRRHGPNFGR